MHGFFITGTDTDVGKTVATAALGLLFQAKKKKVAVVKPVGTGGIDIEGRLYSEDAIFLKKTLNLDLPLELMSPICLKHPLSPKTAADHEKKQIDLAAINIALQKVKDTKPDVTLIEGVGGVLVPLRHDYLVIDLIKALKRPVIIVARTGLGTINHTLLTTSLLKQEKVPIAGIIFNHNHPGEKGISEKTNPKEVERLSGLKILGELPYQKDISKLTYEQVKDHIDISTLL